MVIDPIIEQYLKDGIPFIAYGHDSPWSDTRGCGIFRLDPVTVTLDDNSRIVFRFTLGQLKKLVRSFKKNVPHFLAFLPKNLEKRDKFFQVLVNYDTEFLVEDNNVSDDINR